MPGAVSIHDLAVGAVAPVAPDDVVTLVDVDSDPESVESATAHARRSHRILIGIGTPTSENSTLVDALTFTLIESGDDRRTVKVERIGDAVQQLCEALERNPIAGATVTGLLRTAEFLGVHNALIAESMAYSTLQGGPEYARWLSASNFRPKFETGDPVVIDRVDDRLIIELDRPERHNALDAGMRDALVEALSVAQLDDSVTSVSLLGRGRSFSSGGDLTEFGTSSDPASAHLIRTQHRPGEQIHELSTRLGRNFEARVHGAVMGGGLELAAFAGHIVADPDSAFLLPEMSMGLLPGAGGTVSVSRRIGRWRTAWAVVSGMTFGAAQALEWGLVDEVRPVGA
ncbi:MAG: enoyl-CoA hydratase/isomerase family protein [Rhodococcus sp. (in: high G+C Gram-positive bacteria)]